MKELDNDTRHIELHQHLAPVYNINIGHVEKQINGNYYEYHGSAKEEADSPKRSGSRERKLFVDASSPGEEDMETRKREAERMKSYLTKHHMATRSLTTQRGDSLTEVIVVFVRQWQRLSLVSIPLSGAALVRFLTTDVGLKCETTPKSLANKIVNMVMLEEISVEVERAVLKTFK